ncbi:MAG: ABC-three component system protein [Pseudomonadota bacterium]
MISDKDLKEIIAPPPKGEASAEHVGSGIPIPKPVRVRNLSPDEWEEFIEEWSTSLSGCYKKVRRFGGANDLGVDIAGFCTKNGFEGYWDNYQCKHYDHPLYPSDIWVEIGKIIYYSYHGEYIAPRAYYFVASQGIGTKLEKLLNNPTKLKEQAAANWGKYCRNGITDLFEILLEGELQKYFDAFDFSIFSSKSHIDLVNDHANTGYHAVRFGGGLPQRPKADAPPSTPQKTESPYIRQLLNAYSDHLGENLDDVSKLDACAALKSDFLRQRERFYHAESLRNFARDTVPDGTYASLQDEIYHGVVDIVEGAHANGFERMKSTVAQAAQIATTSNPLASVVKTQDRQGICHQLANDDRLHWVPVDE